MRHLRFVCVTIAVFCVGCATTAGYEKVLNTWVGNSTDHLVSAWGIPTKQYRLHDGSVVMEYTRSSTGVWLGLTHDEPVTTYSNGTINGNAYSQTSTTYVPVTDPDEVLHYDCLTRFTANSAGVITRWAWQGNNCVAKAPKHQ